MSKEESFYSNIKPLDIFMYKSSGLIGVAIGILTLSEWAHVSRYIGVVKNKHMICESHIDTGVVEKEFNPKWIDSIVIYRQFLTKVECINLMTCLRKHIGRKYDWGALPATWFRSTIGLILNLKWLRLGMPILNDKNTEFCSEYQALAGAEAGIPLVVNVSPYNASPADIVRDGLCKKIFEGKDMK